jgi:hypothetical protein
MLQERIGLLNCTCAFSRSFALGGDVEFEIEDISILGYGVKRHTCKKTRRRGGG